MVVPSTLDPEATADARWPSGRPLPAVHDLFDRDALFKEIRVFGQNWLSV